MSEPQWIKEPSRGRTVLTIDVSDRMQHALPPNQLIRIVGAEVVERMTRAFLHEHQDEILASLDVTAIAAAVEANVKATLALKMMGTNR